MDEIDKNQLRMLTQEPVFCRHKYRKYNDVVEKKIPIRKLKTVLSKPQSFYKLISRN